MDEQAMQQIVQALISIGVPQENAMQIAQALGQAQDENQMMQILQQAGLNEQQIQQLGAQLQGGQPQQQAVPQQPMPPQSGGMPQEMPMQGQGPMMAQQGQMPPEMAGAPQQFAYGGRYYKKPVNLMQEELRQKPFIIIEPGNFEGKTRYRKGGFKKKVATYLTGGDFPPSMMNRDVNGGDRMAMEYMDRQRSPQPQTQQQANNKARAVQSNEAPFVASDGSTWQYNGSEYVKIADADSSKAYDPTVAKSDSYETPTQSKTIEEDGTARKRHNDYAKSTYKDDTKIYGSDIEGETELYESRKAKGIEMEKPVEFMPKYAYDSLPDSMKKEADMKLEKGMLQITGEEIADKRKIRYQDASSKGTREFDIDYVAPTKQEVKPVKLSAKQQKAKEEQPKISTPATRVTYRDVPKVDTFASINMEEQAAIQDSIDKNQAKLQLQAGSLKKSSEQKARDAKTQKINDFVEEYKNFIFGKPIKTNEKSIKYGQERGVYDGANEGYTIGDKPTEIDIKLQNLAKRRGLDLIVTPDKIYKKYSGVFSPTVKPNKSEYKYYVGEKGFNTQEEVYKYIMYGKD